jgi:GntR family transcriptional regulator, transcriptional repressor for pyruvate dehydrogenase complex
MTVMESPSAPVVRRRPRRLATELVSELSERIRKRALKPGEQLPTESNIMTEFGVSRTVVREAISGLRSAGMVETKHGIGTFVSYSPTAFVFRAGPSQIPTIRDVLAMLELRVSVEAEAAALAAARRTEPQLRELKRALDDFQAAMQAGGNDAESDFQIHLRIAEATGNRYFPEVLAHFGPATIPRTRLHLLQSGQDQAAYLRILTREHEQIYAAIEQRDSRAAAKFMRAHLSNSSARLQKAQEALQEQLGQPA